MDIIQRTLGIETYRVDKFRWLAGQRNQLPLRLSDIFSIPKLLQLCQFASSSIMHVDDVELNARYSTLMVHAYDEYASPYCTISITDGVFT